MLWESLQENHKMILILKTIKRILNIAFIQFPTSKFQNFFGSFNSVFLILFLEFLEPNTYIEPMVLPLNQIKWLLKDEIASAKHHIFPVTMETWTW